jgi:hypothetical protein
MGKRSSLYEKHEVQDKSVKGRKGKFIQAMTHIKSRSMTAAVKEAK